MHGLNDKDVIHMMININILTMEIGMVILKHMLIV